MKLKLAALSISLIACATPALSQQLKQTNFEDGTGSIGLPTGWQIQSAYRGAVQATGSNGAGVVMKMPWAIIPAGSSLTSLPASQNSPIARPGDILTALREVLRKNGGGAILKSVRASKAGEVSPGTPAYYLLYKFDLQGKEYTAMGYFAPLIYGGDNPWQLYSSVVYAPSAQFAKLAPTLARIWKSWKPNGQKPLEGSNSAVFDKVIKERIDSYEEIQKLFREQL